MALREILAHFGFTFDRAALAQAGAGIEGVKNAAKEAGGKGGLGALADGLKGWLALATGGAFIAFTSEIKLATDELQAWTLQAQLGGASANDFVAGLRKVAKELASGVDESGKQSKLFKQLHIETKNADGSQRDLAEVLPEIAEQFKDMRTGAEKTALATQIFGKAGSKLVPILAKGAEGVAEMRKQLEDLGGGFSKEAIENADEYDDNLIKLQFSLRGLKSLIGVQIFPVLADLIGAVTKIGTGFTGWIKTTTFLSSAVKILIGLVGVKLLAALAPFLLPGLKFVAIFLAVDDLIAFLTGKKSVIGDILNSWFGAGTAERIQQWFADWKAIVSNFWDDFKNGAAIGTDTVLGQLMAFLLDAGNGFEVFGKSVSVIIADISLGFQAGILAMQASWNNFVGSLKLPPAIAKALNIDTGSAGGRVAEATTAKAQAGDEFNRAKSRQVEDFRQSMRDRGFAGVTDGMLGRGAPTANIATGPVKAPTVSNQNWVEVKPVITVTVPPGTSAAQSRYIAREIATQMDATGRAAVQSLEQRIK